MLPLIVLIIVNGGKDVLKNVDIARGIQMWKNLCQPPSCRRHSLSSSTWDNCWGSFVGFEKKSNKWFRTHLAFCRSKFDHLSQGCDEVLENLPWSEQRINLQILLLEISLKITFGWDNITMFSDQTCRPALRKIHLFNFVLEEWLWLFWWNILHKSILHDHLDIQLCVLHPWSLGVLFNKEVDLVRDTWMRISQPRWRRSDKMVTLVMSSSLYSSLSSMNLMAAK